MYSQVPRALALGLEREASENRIEPEVDEGGWKPLATRKEGESTLPFHLHPPSPLFPLPSSSSSSFVNMNLEQRLAALEESDRQKTLLVEAQAGSIALLSSESVCVQRRVLEAQQRLVGELSNSIFPEGHWIQKVGEVGKPAPWEWSLVRI